MHWCAENAKMAAATIAKHAVNFKWQVWPNIRFFSIHSNIPSVWWAAAVAVAVIIHRQIHAINGLWMFGEEIFTLNLTCRFGCRRTYYLMYGNLCGHHMFRVFFHGREVSDSEWKATEKNTQCFGLSNNVCVFFSLLLSIGWPFRHFISSNRILLNWNGQCVGCCVQYCCISSMFTELLA